LTCRTIRHRGKKGSDLPMPPRDAASSFEDRRHQRRLEDGILRIEGNQTVGISRLRVGIPFAVNAFAIREKVAARANLRSRIHEQGSFGSVRAPARQSFGARLIETIGRQLKGNLKLTYEPGGFVYALTVPLGSLNVSE